MMPNEVRSAVESSLRGAPDESCAASTPRMSVVATVRKSVSHSRRTLRSAAAATTPLLLDCTGDAEDGQVHGDEEATDRATEEDHHDGLDQRGERGDAGVDLIVVEVGD